MPRTLHALIHQLRQGVFNIAVMCNTQMKRKKIEISMTEENPLLQTPSERVTVFLKDEFYLDPNLYQCASHAKKAAKNAIKFYTL